MQAQTYTAFFVPPAEILQSNDIAKQDLIPLSSYILIVIAFLSQLKLHAVRICTSWGSASSYNGICEFQDSHDDEFCHTKLPLAYDVCYGIWESCKKKNKKKKLCHYVIGLFFIRCFSSLRGMKRRGITCLEIMTELESSSSFHYAIRW